MNFGYECAGCHTYFGVSNPDGDLGAVQRLLNQDAPCPKCDNGTIMTPVVVEVAGRPGDMCMTADDLLRYVNGLGAPGETIFSCEDVRQWLETYKVIEADVEGSDRPRPVIRSLLLKGGIRLYLAASGNGAVVYRVTKETEDASSGI